jgi:hypothetical protein
MAQEPVYDFEHKLINGITDKNTPQSLDVYV